MTRLPLHTRPGLRFVASAGPERSINGAVLGASPMPDRIRRTGWWVIHPWPTAGFAVALFLLVGIGVISQLGTLHLTQTGQWVVHTHEVLRGIEEAVSDLLEAESWQHAYLGTADRAYLERYRAAERRTQAAVRHLRILTADNPKQQQRVTVLDGLVTRRLSLLEQGSLSVPASRTRESESGTLMSEVATVADDMRAEEQALLRGRAAAFRDSAGGTNLVIEFANLLALALVIGGLWLVNRAAARRFRAEEALRQAHAGLERRVAERTAELRAANAVLETEIAERRRSQEKASQLAALVESSADSIVGLSLEGIILTWNAGAQRLHGLTAEETRGRPLADLVPSDRPDELPGCLARIRRGEHVEPFETVQLKGDGTRVDIWLTVSPVHDGGGRVVGASAVARDISERKRLEQQFRQSQKMEAIGKLAGGIAHDFNNLLTVIGCSSDLLLSRLAPDGPGRELLEEIRRAGERAAVLTRQLLAFSRQQVLQPRITDLNCLIRDTERMLRRLIGEDVDLVTGLDPTLSRVKVDPGQIEQVLVNLAVNARDAMPRGGRLTIETADVVLDQSYARARPEVRPGRYVMVGVTDTGCGMDAATKTRIFDPFFTTKEVGKGTGLGLATVYGVIKQSGGFIYVQSEPGTGTSFRIYLPPAEGLPESPAESHSPVPSVAGKETVLLVEDEDAVRALTMSVLQERGYSVLEAEDGRQALQLTEQHPGPIHLLVSDVVMPRMGGREVADRLSAQRPETRVLFISGYTDDAVVRHGVHEAEVEFLTKPFTPEALARKVREVLEKAPVTPGGEVFKS